MSEIFHGLDAITSDRICYGVITRDEIYRVWVTPTRSHSNGPDTFYWKLMRSANIVIDLTNQRYIKHRNCERLPKPSDEVRILFAHVKKYEFIDNILTPMEENHE